MYWTDVDLKKWLWECVSLINMAQAMY